MKQASFQPALTPDFVARALALNLPATAASKTPFTSITSDSRKVQAGCLFVALKGDKFDGHDFIDKALSQGARGVLCGKGVSIPPTAGVAVFSVEDTLLAYRKLGAAWRREFSIPVIAVAGSVGKTTTKELLHSILKGKWPSVLKTQGSQNGFIGIPMTLLELLPEHGAAVIEVGIDEIGAMAQHLPLVNATASVLTTIGPEHLEKLIDVPTVAREEGIALSHVAQGGGLVAINLDDPWVRPHAATIRDGKKICYTLQGRTASNGETLTANLDEDGTRLDVQGVGNFEMPLLGIHNAGNLLAAIAVARGLGLTGEEIQLGLKTFQGVAGRSEIRDLGTTRVLCDYYNANPTSTEAGLELLSQLAKKSGKPVQRWACLADMLELGPDELEFHRGLAVKLTSLGVEHVLLYGPRMRALHEELESRGFPGTVSHFETHAALAEILVRKAPVTDVILIKGSRGMRMEEVWKLLETARK